MRNKKQQYIGVAIILIVILNIFLIYNKRENSKNINSDIENNDMAILVNGEAQSTIPAKGIYNVTVNCTNGTASWDCDNWGIIISTIDKGNIKCSLEFETTNLRIASDVVATGKFLEGPLVKNTIEKLEFVETNKVPTDAIGSWDVSAQQNGSIMAWYYDVEVNGLYEVIIGGNGGVVANSDSSYLFQNLTYLSSINLANLDTSNVTNMYEMFYYTGYSSTVFTLDLGNEFDTSNVTNMRSMFDETGYSSTVFTLDLGDKFDTSNVTNMRAMFYHTGYSSKVFTLDLGDKFDTSNVTNMLGMFANTGYSCSVFTLNFGDKFDTSNVTNMQSMFYYTGYFNPNLILNLRNFNFDKVTNYSTMFTGSRTTFTIYVKSASDATWVLDKGFKGTIIDCSSNTCP